MPHIVIRCFKADIPSATVDRMREALTSVIQEQLGCTESAVSIDLQQIEPSEWAKEVYHPFIEPRLETLVKRPGYRC